MKYSQEELLAKLEAQQKQIDLLTKTADKSKLSRFQPREEMGTSILISTYQNDLNDNPRVVTSWKMLKDKVRVTKQGVEEEQIVEITLASDGTPESKKNSTIQMSYADFAMKYIQRERVQAKDIEVIKGKQIAVFDYRGKEYRVELTYIN